MVESILLSAVLFGSHYQEVAEYHLLEQSLPQFREFYLQAGVLGPEERESFFVQVHSLEYDLSVMRHREENLTPETPPFDFVLPSREFCFANYQLARKFVSYLEWRLKHNLEPAFEENLQLVLLEAKWRLSVWDLLSDCSGTWKDYDGKRLKLQKVKAAVGKEKFELCNWPDPLPKAAVNSDWEWYYRTVSDE